MAATSTGHELKCVRIFAAGALLAEGELMLSSTSAHSNVAAPLQSSQECGASHDAELKQRSGKIEAMSKSAHETEASCWPDGTLWPRLLSWSARSPVAMTTGGHGHEVEARRKRRERDGDPQIEATTAVR